MDLDCSDLEDTHKIKVVLLGDRSVGKSSIIKRFIRDEFDDHLNPTVGIDFMSRQIQYRQRRYKLELWDTAGQEKYRSLVKNYLKDADCALFVFDVNDIKTYNHIPEWTRLFYESTKRQAVCVIVGNKIDVKSKQQNSNNSTTFPEPGEQTKQIDHYWVSAKQGKNVTALFQNLIQQVLKKDILSTRILPESTRIFTQKPKLLKCCFL